MQQTTKLNIVDRTGQTIGELDAAFTQFSAYRCFPMEGTAEELGVLRRLVQMLAAYGPGLALYRQGPFLDFLLDHADEELGKAGAIIDPGSSESQYRGLPVVRAIEELEGPIAVVFICETRAEPLGRIAAKVSQRFRVLKPDIARGFGFEVPAQAWIGKVKSIYPMALPEYSIRPDLDLLLLDLPARAGQQISVGTSYVHSAMKRTKARFQTLDLDPLWYHRFQMHRLLDLGCEPVLGSGVRLSAEAWGYNERIWNDPRQWPFLLTYFAEDIRELMARIVEARPKILGLSVHARNEWITRHVARAVKAALPETIILVGGHSCYSEHFGRGAFPEFEYMVIGEADLVLGPLVERLARGERPANTPGVISVFDDPGLPFQPGAPPEDLDALGGISLDIWDDTNLMYQTWTGRRSTATPLTRGCVWSKCSFCAERFAFRTRSPENYVDELDSLVAAGRGEAFFASDSDFGGQPEVLYRICEEIVRRGLRITFNGQIRLNRKYNVEFFKLMRAAGISSLNFGADAFTKNTIRQQAKGYSLDTLIRNHRDCIAAGVTPEINMVIGVPGETEQDITDTIRLFVENRDCFPHINNINTCALVQNSVYWFEPERFGIRFYGDREAIYRKYYFGIPSRLWYSTDPFIDRAVRSQRFLRIINELQAAGIGVGREVFSNLHDLIGGVGHLDFREFLVDDLVDHGQRGVPAGPGRALPAPIFPDHLFALNRGEMMAFPHTPETIGLLDRAGITFSRPQMAG
jgi:hypothetical protein